MSLIFDRFPNYREAALFVSVVVEKYGLTCSLYPTQDKANAADPFPYVLEPPIVHVERGDDPALEAALEAHAQACGGRFAGT